MSGSLKVLVVDDEAPIRKLLRMGLSSKGYEVLEAYDEHDSVEHHFRKTNLP